MMFAQITSRTRYDLVALDRITEFWHFALLLGICLAVAAFTAWMYRRDTREMHWGVALSLGGLRLLALGLLLFTYLDLEKRTEREMVQNSRVVFLIDTSQSMAQKDPAAASDGSTAIAVQPPRIEQVAEVLADGKLLEGMREKHDVTLLRFDESETASEIKSLPKLVDTAPATRAAVDEVDLLSSLEEARLLVGIATALIGIGLFGSIFYFFVRRPDAPGASITLLVAVVCLAAGCLLMAFSNLRNPHVTMAAAFGQEDVDSLEQRLAELQSTSDLEEENSDSGDETPDDEPPVDWQAALMPAGASTRLGEALLDVIDKERGSPVAGIVLISDGRNNAGLPYGDALLQARDAGIPIYTVGLGATTRPANVALVDIEAPERVYPGDRFTVTGFVQAFRLPGEEINARLVSYDQDQPEDQREERIEDEQLIELPGEGDAPKSAEGGDVQLVKFEVEPPAEAQTRVYQIRLDVPAADHNDADNAKAAAVQIVERRTRVLLLAGGPTREFRFLRNHLYRDEDTICHVFLQSGRPGISQEADELLFEFPEDEDELFQYDAIVAFDPDWESLDDLQIRMLERWVDKQAGGLVVLAGPIFTPRWAKQRRGDYAIDLLKGLYPVVFSENFEGDFRGDEGSPLVFTREGLASQFLWLEESAAASRDTWMGFDGVFGYYAVKDVKPGASIYAHFGNEDEAVGGELPIYMAGQYYGAGRVFFLASGEMWRLRKFDPTYFQNFYTKLIRHVAEGRLLRDSKRGVLMVDNRRAKLGDQITVRARLTDAQHRPLSADKYAKVTLDINLPDGGSDTIELHNVNQADATAMAGREGMYVGQFVATQQGDYGLVLEVPESGGTEVLNQQIAVRAPLKEIAQPERNEALLEDLAKRTDGWYFRELDIAAGEDEDLPSLVDRIDSRDRTSAMDDLPDKDFERRLMWWQLGLICGALCLEWLIRRTSKLA